ncbi:MAG: hypothetical protein GOMPHAMPRED_008183 [Gomphillus americanus]|uniref:Structural maintenance of chromosomes protein n=1 Tax=Gomphillus americanus TaxID=1940652 RepID=A0A8H3I4C3_9LECA|nr:MAG: hypothetical protein GOMPHAMPRED_008183 [Gomphillus americanus]
MGKLIRLELNNFKSYKGHHILLFGDSYFTSIIGPNGSGKSNSMDAISFVLGIKSSHLRSSQLKDLVYRGRVLRHSTINEDGSATATNGVNGHTNGDLSQGSQERNDPKSAWVMAVYEDDAGEEQQWKRTITAQGSSEYRINNRVVNAQQYNEALEAENILIKARNFLVFQGDVEAIASQSPKDLTRLIEQISGSLEYKAEYERLKEASEEAIEHQNYNLNRRRGINSEIKQYQEQKREAENYAKKLEQKDQAVVTHILWKLYQFQSTIESSEVLIKKHQEELKEYRRSIEKYEHNLEEAKKDHARKSKEVYKVEKDIKEKEAQIDDRANSLLPISEKISLTKDSFTKVQARIQAIDKERQQKHDAVKRLAKDLQTVEKAESQWTTEWNKLNEQEGQALTEDDLAEYNKLKEEVVKQTSADQIGFDNLSRQHRADEEAVKSLGSKVEATQARILDIETELQRVKDSKATAQAAVDQAQQSIQEKKTSYNKLNSERLRVRQLRTELEEKFNDVSSKVIEADEGKKQNDRDAKMRQIISDLKRLFPGVRGRVHELCKPKLKRYEEAVSTVLGRNFDSIVVDDEKTAKDCIQHLREQHRGQATFIPLDTIQGTTIDSTLKGIASGTRMAIDTIDYDRSVERAMAYACGNALVCDDLVTAKRICFEKGIEAKAVTLDGTVIHRAGLMTGGRGKEEKRRWDDTDIDALRKLAEKIYNDIRNLPDNRRDATSVETLQSEIAGLEQSLAYNKEEIQSLDRNVASKNKELAHAQKELKEAKPELQKRQKELANLAKVLKSNQDKIAGVEDQIFADFCQRTGYENIRAYEVQQGSLQQEAAQKRLEFQTQKSKLQNRRNFEQQQLDDIQSRISALKAKSDRETALIKQLEQEKDQIGHESDSLEAELEILKQNLEKHEAVLQKKSEKVTEQRRELQKRSTNAQGTLKEVARLESDIQRSAADRYAVLKRCKMEDITVPLTSASASLDKLPLTGILQGNPKAMDTDENGVDTSSSALDIPDFGIEIDFDQLDDDIKEEQGEATDQDLQSKITNLEEELKQMAPNMRAIERLEGVESRLKTTEKEFEDARRRAKKARDDFQEIKDQRFELFNKAFSHISDQIGPIYRELTKSASLPMGGQASLDMEDSDEPYLDGIKYHAMPPLKRFRDMEHLSGGEKTMAALALLFSIHSYQPSPFFVLDEVDAALDNTNVTKIANYIREHAGPGMQFIVISLKTGLFQGSEALVGIHRDQSNNTSKALTLDLRKYL